VSQPVLQVRDLRVYYHTKRGAAKAVDGVTFALQARERFGLVGESGSGKSTTGLAILRLIKPPGQIEGGEVLLDGLNVLAISEERMRGLRLATIALVAQGAMNSLNPVIRVREQLVDALTDHRIAGARRDYDRRVNELLAAVGLPQEVASRYPHELSGGMKQRVCIAIAISLRPKIIIADEPTSALDVVVQRQVMATLRAVQEDIGAAVILIGHDMGLMAQFVDRLGVMYAGELVEVSPVEEIFEEPLHPYTRLLVECLPSIERKGVFEGIPGLPPSLLDRPAGCPFHPRCPFVMDRCRVEPPRLAETQSQRWVACHLYGGAA
jgi:oligopeptide/dipeptide ABC transporter ATP-binding protein